MADPAFIFSIAVVLALVSGILIVSHIGARRVRRVRMARSPIEEEPPRPFDEPAPTEMTDEERFLRVLFGEWQARQRRRRAKRESTSSDAPQAQEERSSS